MAVTGSQVISRLESVFTDTSSAKWTAAQKLEAVNMAIDDAWPAIKDTATDTSITLASTTYEYTPSATPEPELGYMQAYVSMASNPKVLLRRIRQRRSGSTISILVPTDIASAFGGETLHLLYHTRIARIAAASDSIEMPLDYLWKSAAYWMCVMALTKAAHFEVRVYDGLAAQYQAQATEAKRRAWRNRITPTIAWANDSGAANVSGRYGQNIVENP